MAAMHFAFVLLLAALYSAIGFAIASPLQNTDVYYIPNVRPPVRRDLAVPEEEVPVRYRIHQRSCQRLRLLGSPIRTCSYKMVSIFNYLF